MNISDWIAFIAFVVSAYGIYLSYKQNKTTIEWDFYKQELQQAEQAKQNYYTKNISRINLMPHFHLLLNKEIEVVPRGKDEEILVLPISLINVGRENATNIQIAPISDDGISSHYFKTDKLDGEHHDIRNYIDKQYAMIGETINFTVGCNKHDQALNVFFKIRFDDIVGRTYEQNFRFLYGYNVSNEFTMNHTSYLPKCIDEQDKTIENTSTKNHESYNI